MITAQHVVNIVLDEAAKAGRADESAAVKAIEKLGHPPVELRNYGQDGQLFDDEFTSRADAH